jgi:hypothetical protein
MYLSIEDQELCSKVLEFLTGLQPIKETVGKLMHIQDKLGTML